MTPRIITTALLATLALGFVPAAASAHDRDDDRDGGRDGYSDAYRQDGRGYPDDYRGRDHDGYGGQYARQGYYGRQQGYNGQGYYGQGYNGQGYAQRGYGGGYNDGYNGAYNGAYNGGYYQQRPAAYGYNGYGQDNRYRCRNNTGTILGAIAGGLIGNGVAGRGDRLLGTVIGGGAGALVGNGIDKNNRRC